MSALAEQVAAALAEHRVADWLDTDPKAPEGWRLGVCGARITSEAAHQADAVLRVVAEWLGSDEVRNVTARALCASVNPGGHGWHEHRDDWSRDATAALDALRDALRREVQP